MTRESIKKAVAEAKRFLAAAKAATDALDGLLEHYSSPKETGALRRASMDLTRSLAEMRRP